MSLPSEGSAGVFEREYLRRRSTASGRDIARTAEFVGMERSALHRKLKASASTECRAFAL